MANTIRCPNCGDESPADGRFCIECGATLAPAAVGETTRLPGVRCPSCGNNNPEGARFCVVCGRGLVEGATRRPAPQPAPWQPPAGPPAPPASRPHSPQQHSYPRVASAPAPLPAAPQQQPWPQHKPSGLPNIAPVLFIIGIFVLLSTGRFWPGILWLAGIAGCVAAVQSGRGDKALGILIWTVGLAVLFSTGTFWPGILVLVFLSMMVNGRGRSCW